MKNVENVTNLVLSANRIQEWMFVQTCMFIHWLQSCDIGLNPEYPRENCTILTFWVLVYYYCSIGIKNQGQLFILNGQLWLPEPQWLVSLTIMYRPQPYLYITLFTCKLGVLPTFDWLTFFHPTTLTVQNHAVKFTQQNTSKYSITLTNYWKHFWLWVRNNILKDPILEVVCLVGQISVGQLSYTKLRQSYYGGPWI